MRIVSVLVLACFALVACAPAPRTQLTVRIDADEAMRRDVRVVRVEVLGGDSVETLGQRHMEDVPVTEWPFDIALVPVDRDPTRVVRVSATALDGPRGSALASIRVDTGFVSGRTIVLERAFEAACRGIVCEGPTSCVAGRCVSSAVEAGLLPDLLVDAAVGAIDAPVDASLAPDAWSVPVRAEGEPCDLAGEASVCAPGTACTCTGLDGCGSGSEPARCWASRDIGCARPIDLTERVARSTRFELTGDGTSAPDIVPGTCLASGGELVYLVRAPDRDLDLQVSSTGGMEFWFQCSDATSWGRCTGTWSFMVPRGGAAYVLVEGAGEHQLRVQRTP